MLFCHEYVLRVVAAVVAAVVGSVGGGLGGGEGEESDSSGLASLMMQARVACNLEPNG